MSCLAVSFLRVTPIHAADFTAVQSGNWNDPATWGGTIPTSSDDVTIPGNIQVTIPNGLNVTRTATTTINGWLFNHGTFTNDNTGTLNNDGMIQNLSTFTNTGMLNNNDGYIQNLSSFTNNGTFTNDSIAEFDNYGTLTNNGIFTNNLGGKLDNYGTVNNTNTINNSGTINNHCGGIFTGNSVSGNAINNIPCPTDTSTNTPTDIPTDIPVDTPTATATCAINVIAPRLISPAHRAHTIDTTPTFTWSQISGAQSYRLMVYSEDRSFEYKKRLVGQTKTSYTLTSAEALTPAKYLWRVRTQDLNCGMWTDWSKRYVLFID